jgi:hypothetical protein
MKPVTLENPVLRLTLKEMARAPDYPAWAMATLPGEERFFMTYHDRILVGINIFPEGLLDNTGRSRWAVVACYPDQGGFYYQNDDRQFITDRRPIDKAEAETWLAWALTNLPTVLMMGALI